MADTFTQQSTFSSDTTAYEMLAYFYLRPQLFFDAVTDVRPTNQSHRGAAVQFNIYTDLAAQTTPLTETADPNAIAASDSTVTLTLVEYGAVIKTTAKLVATSFLDIDADMANLIGYNAGLSVDTLAQTALSGGSNVRYSSTTQARANVTPTDALTSSNVRRAGAELRKANVPTVNGNLYWAFIHPDISYDFRGATGTNTWRDPHTYSAPENIWSGEIGAFEGFRFIETPRGPIFADSGSSPTTTDVYGTIFGGKQALAKAHANSAGYGQFPTLVKGDVVDALKRIQPLGWKWLGAYGRFREESLRRVESGSSIGS